MGANAELYRRCVEAWNDRDAERFLELAHPEIEFRSRLAAVEGGVYRGHEGMRSYFADLEETFGEIRMEVEEIEERGDWVVATLRQHGTGRASGAEVEWKLYQAARAEDGLFIEGVAEQTKPQVLAAAGLE